MKQDISGCMGHSLSPFRGLVIYSVALTHGLRHGLHSSAASRLRLLPMSASAATSFGRGTIPCG